MASTRRIEKRGRLKAGPFLAMPRRIREAPDPCDMTHSTFDCTVATRAFPRVIRSLHRGSCNLGPSYGGWSNYPGPRTDLGTALP